MNDIREIIRELRELDRSRREAPKGAAWRKLAEFQRQAVFYMPALLDELERLQARRQHHA